MYGTWVTPTLSSKRSWPPGASSAVDGECQNDWTHSESSTSQTRGPVPHPHSLSCDELSLHSLDDCWICIEEYTWLYYHVTIMWQYGPPLSLWQYTSWWMCCPWQDRSWCTWPALTANHWSAGLQNEIYNLWLVTKWVVYTAASSPRPSQLISMLYAESFSACHAILNMWVRGTWDEANSVHIPQTYIVHEKLDYVNSISLLYYLT